MNVCDNRQWAAEAQRLAVENDKRRTRIAELEAALSALHCAAAGLHDWVDADIQPGQNVPEALTYLYHQMRFSRAALAKAGALA